VQLNTGAAATLIPTPATGVGVTVGTGDFLTFTAGSWGDLTVTFTGALLNDTTGLVKAAEGTLTNSGTAQVGATVGAVKDTWIVQVIGAAASGAGFTRPSTITATITGVAAAANAPRSIPALTASPNTIATALYAATGAPTGYSGGSNGVSAAVVTYEQATGATAGVITALSVAIAAE
jgi:hypothetical protein